MVPIWRKLLIRTLLTKLNKSLIYRIIFYKHFYKFIFLHKPLCEKYRQNTLKVFNLYICKSCLLLYTGFFITIATIIQSQNYFALKKNSIIIASLGMFTFIISYPTFYKRFRRIIRDIIRFFDGIFLAIYFVFCFKIHIIIGLFSIIFFANIRNYYNRKRSGERICKDCFELMKGKTCIGYIQQKEALLKIEEEYSNIMSAKLMKKRKDFIYD